MHVREFRVWVLSFCSINFISNSGHAEEYLSFPRGIRCKGGSLDWDYGFVHTTTSPHYPQSNGEAERAVQTIEVLLKKAQYY